MHLASQIRVLSVIGKDVLARLHLGRWSTKGSPEASVAVKHGVVTCAALQQGQDLQRGSRSGTWLSRMNVEGVRQAAMASRLSRFSAFFGLCCWWQERVGPGCGCDGGGKARRWKGEGLPLHG